MNTYPVCDCVLFRDRRVAALLFRAELTLEQKPYPVCFLFVPAQKLSGIE